jgi:hypothetical protein
VVQGSSLVPRDDGPVLFTTSGMHPLTPYLEGRPHPRGRRLTGLQRCLRTTDLGLTGLMGRTRPAVGRPGRTPAAEACLVTRHVRRGRLTPT